MESRTGRPLSVALAEVKPMLLEERKRLPRSGDWHFEWKFDGYRLLAGTSPLELKTRNGADATHWFPEVTRALSLMPPGCIFDGEVAVLDDLGRSDFDRLHARARRRGWYAGADLVAYCIFDLLAGRGRDIRGLPIEQRKCRLRELLATPIAGLLFVDWVDDGAWLYDAAVALQLEGVVAKRAGSVYVGKRSADWVKIKRPGAIPPGRFKRGSEG